MGWFDNATNKWFEFWQQFQFNRNPHQGVDSDSDRITKLNNSTSNEIPDLPEPPADNTTSDPNNKKLKPPITDPSDIKNKPDYEDEFYDTYSKLFQYDSSSYSLNPAKDIYLNFYNNDNLIYSNKLIDGDYTFNDNNIKVYPSTFIRRNVKDYDTIKNKLLNIKVSFRADELEGTFIKEMSPDKKEIKIAYLYRGVGTIEDDWKYIVTNVNSLYNNYDHYITRGDISYRIINAKLDSSFYDKELIKLNVRKDALMKAMYSQFLGYVNMTEDELLSSSLHIKYLNATEEDIPTFISQDTRFIDLIKEYEKLLGHYYIDIKLETPLKKVDNNWVSIFRQPHETYQRDNIVFWQKVHNQALISDEYISSEQKLTRQTLSSSLEDLSSGSNQTDLMNYFDLIYDKNKRVDDLNIDYSDYSNFVYFGSATGQVENAYRKCNNFSSSYSVSSSYEILNEFTPYQRWVYDYKFRQFSSSQFVSWYNDEYDTATEYDNTNKYSLIKNVPEQMLLNTGNENLILLMKSYGDFYDDIKVYIDNFGSLFNFNYDYDNGLPKEIIYAFSDFFGWELHESFDLDALGSWLRLNPDDQTAISGSADVTREKWLRVLSCMPYLNKVRGTRKSIDAILNIYGIPSTILEVHEYGGYNDTFTQSYVNNVYDYYLSSSDAQTQYITIPESIVSQSLEGDYTIEMMFKPSQALTGSYLVSSADTTSSIQTSQNVLTASYGNITYSNISSSLAFDNDFELFNTNYWYHLIYQVSGSDTVNMYAKVFDDSIMEIDESVSAPLTESSFPSEALNMFSDYLGGAKEIRFWNKALDEDEINQHVYNYNDISTKVGLSTNNLLAWYKLNDNKDLSVTSNLNDYSPSPKVDCSSSGFIDNAFVGLSSTNLVQLDYFNLDKYNDNNIFIDGTVSQSLGNERTAQTENRNVIDILFKPNNVINKKIIETFSMYDFNNIAKPQYIYESKYKELDNLSNYYALYYDENINYNDYIKYIQNFDVSLMKMIKQVLPERVDMDSGIEIENTILQRQKIQNIRPTVSLNNPNGVIDYEDSILLNGDMYSLSSSVDCGQKISIEDSSFKFYSPASITHNYSTMNYLMGTAFWKGTQNTKESSYDNSSPVEVSASSQTVLYVKK